MQCMISTYHIADTCIYPGWIHFRAPFAVYHFLRPFVTSGNALQHNTLWHPWLASSKRELQRDSRTRSKAHLEKAMASSPLEPLNQELSS